MTNIRDIFYLAFPALGNIAATIKGIQLNRLGVSAAVQAALFFKMVGEDREIKIPTNSHYIRRYRHHGLLRRGRISRLRWGRTITDRKT